MLIKVSGLYPTGGNSLKPKTDMIKVLCVREAMQVTTGDRLEGGTGGRERMRPWSTCRKQGFPSSSRCLTQS